MRWVQRILLSISLFGFGAAVAQDIPPQQACYQKCIKPIQECQKKCGNDGRCLVPCAKELGKCTDRCGGPPPPTQNR